MDLVFMTTPGKCYPVPMDERKQYYLPTLDRYVEQPDIPRYTSEQERLREEHRRKTEASMLKFMRDGLTPRKRRR